MRRHGRVVPHVLARHAGLHVGDEELVLDEDVVFGPGDGGHQRLHDAVLGPVLAARPVTHTPHHLTRT